MTKHVVSNSECFHLWAHQAQDWARGSSVSFRGPDAYSYRARIGAIETNAQGDRVFLTSSSRWSSTTSQHQSMLQSAIPESETVFNVLLNRTNEGRLEALLEEIVELQGKARRARRNKPYILQQVQQQLEHAQRFASWAGLQAPPDIEGIKQAIADARNKAEADYLEREEARKKREADTLAWNRQGVHRWVQGLPDIGSPRHNVGALPEAYLRIEGEECVTNHGARVPVEHVRKAINRMLIAAEYNILHKERWEPVHAIRLGHYQLNCIEDDGTVVIGCHRFLISEVRRIHGLFCEGVNAEHGQIPANAQEEAVRGT